jgi:uncharacterized protein (TIGR01777 family)
MSIPILVAGGSGFVGRALVAALRAQQHTVFVLTTKRGSLPEGHVFWDTERKVIDPTFRCGECLVINLAGAGVADKRWTAARKAVILSSRVDSLATLYSAHALGQIQIRKLVSASAIGFYGMAAGLQTEASEGDDSYLSVTCKAWEAAALRIGSEFSVPVAIARIGIVLDPEGGALKELMKTFPMRVAGLPGSGQQIYSWIHRNDLVRLLMWLAFEPITGIYNAVAPEPVSLGTLMDAAKKAYGGFFITVPAPSWAIQLLLGEMAVEVLKSTEVSSAAIQGTGFRFEHASISAAMASLIS